MNINLVFTLGIAIAAGAAIYFLFQEMQQQKRRTEAMAQHLRRLEGLVWAYNIRPQQENEHEASSDFIDGDDHEAADENDENDENEIIDCQEQMIHDILGQIPIGVFTVKHRSAAPPEPAKIEEINEQDEQQDEQHEPAKVEEIKENDEQKCEESEEPTQQGTRIYADTAKNRRLGRVGKTY